MNKQKVTFISLLAVILIAESVLTGLLPQSRGYLFGFLESKLAGIYVALGLYYCNYLFLDFFQAIKHYFVLKVSLLYRTIRTEKVISEGVDETKTNIPQRIQEDIKLSYHSRITVWCEYLISGTILIQLTILNLSAPLLVAASLAYAGISVLIAYLFNPRLTKAEKLVQHKEANFRTSLIERLTPKFLYDANDANLQAGKVRMEYALFTKLQLGVMSVLPYIVLIPSLIAGDITLGTLMKHQATFALIVVNASILIQYFTILIQGRASDDRVKEIEQSKD